MTRGADELLCAVGFVTIVGAALFLGWITGYIDATPPVPQRPAWEGLKLDKPSPKLTVEVGGRVVTVEEKR